MESAPCARRLGARKRVSSVSDSESEPKAKGPNTKGTTDGTIDAADARPTRSGRATLWGYARGLFFVLGVAFVAFLVKDAGPQRVLDVMVAAGPWLPAIMLLDVAFLLSDSFAVYRILGDRARNIPRAAWVRSAALAYAFMVLLPAGRAAGEVARAAELAPHVEKTHATIAVTHLSAGYMFANAMMSALTALLAVRYGGVRTPLAMLAGLNALATGGMGVLLVTVSRSERLKRWLLGRFPKLARGSFSQWFERERSGVPVATTLICLSARCAQVLQYGLVLVAVGAVVSVPRAVLTMGIHLVSATVGDMVPNQAGVSEGVYSAFADWMGLAHAPERALSVVLVVRIAQLSLALICLAASTLLGRTAREGARTGSGPEGALVK